MNLRRLVTACSQCLAIKVWLPSIVKYEWSRWWASRHVTGDNKRRDGQLQTKILNSWVCRVTFQSRFFVCNEGLILTPPGLARMIVVKLTQLDAVQKRGTCSSWHSDTNNSNSRELSIPFCAIGVWSGFELNLSPRISAFKANWRAELQQDSEQGQCTRILF